MNLLLRDNTYVELKKKLFLCFRYSKIKCKKSGTKKYCISQVTAFRVKCLREPLGRLSTSKRVFLKLYFSTRQAEDVEQFLSDRLEISTIFVKLNCFFHMFKIVRITKHFSRFVYEKKNSIKMLQFFQKSILKKKLAYFYIYNEEIFFFFFRFKWWYLQTYLKKWFFSS